VTVYTLMITHFRRTET